LQVVWQYDDRIDSERTPSPYNGERAAQCCNILRQQVPPPFQMATVKKNVPPGTKARM
jgi:hypothetical protein